MRRLRNILLIVAALTAAAVAYRVLGVYEFRAGECTATPPRRFSSSYPKRLRVMTYNIEGHASLLKPHHIEEIAATINRHHPDIVGLNEVHRGTWQSRFGDHTQELHRLTGMNVVFGTSYTFLGGDFGNAVLTRGTVLSSEVHKMPGTGEPRSLLETTVAIDGGVIEFFVGHTTAWAALGRSARDLQLKCMNAHVQASPHPYILTGDLNAPPDTPEIARFLQSNTLRFAGDPRTPTHKLMEERLDYILTDPGWTVASARVLDEGPSDHRPVLVELTHP